MPLQKNLNTLIMPRNMISLLYMTDVIIYKTLKITFIKERIGQQSVIHYVGISANKQPKTNCQYYIHRAALPSHSSTDAIKNA